MNKQIFLSLALLLAVGSAAPTYAQRHRHTPRTENVARQSEDKAATTAGAAKAGGNDEGIEAYSDTTSVQDEDTTAYAGNDSGNAVDDSNLYSPDRFADPISWFAYICSKSFFGIVVTIVIILLVLLFLLMPLILILLLLRYLVRRHNDRVRLAEKAIEQGMPLTEEEMPLSRKSPEYMWRRGVRNVSIGLGLMLFFWFLGANPLVGIGGLVAVLGAGQMFMVRYNYNSTFFRRGSKRGDHDDFDGLDGEMPDLRFGDDEKKK